MKFDCKLTLWQIMKIIYNIEPLLILFIIFYDQKRDKKDFNNQRETFYHYD